MANFKEQFPSLEHKDHFITQLDVQRFSEDVNAPADGEPFFSAKRQIITVDKGTEYTFQGKSRAALKSAIVFDSEDIAECCLDKQRVREVFDKLDYAIDSEFSYTDLLAEFTALRKELGL